MIVGWMKLILLLLILPTLATLPAAQGHTILFLLLLPVIFEYIFQTKVAWKIVRGSAYVVQDVAGRGKHCFQWVLIIRKNPFLAKLIDNCYCLFLHFTLQQHVSLKTSIFKTACFLPSILFAKKEQNLTPGFQERKWGKVGFVAEKEGWHGM